MAKDLVSIEDHEERRERAKELWERALELRRDGEVLAFEMGEVFKEIRDGKYYKEMGYTAFQAFTQEVFGLSKESAYRYIRVIENVIDALPAEVSTRLTNGSIHLPLKVLAAIRFDHGELSEAEIERLKSLPAEQLEAELIRLGYDRDSMGGRGASDVGRRLVERKRYRDQSRKIGRLKEERKSLEAEKSELQKALEEMRQMHREAIEAVKDPKAKAVLLELDRLRTRVQELEEKETEREAALRVGKEVPGAASQFLGEITILCAQFFDTVRVDDLDGWIAVHDATLNGKQALDDLRGRMAEVLNARIAAGEIAGFSIGDPRAAREMADFALAPRRKAGRG